jgi:hypothetical protein
MSHVASTVVLLARVFRFARCGCGCGSWSLQWMEKVSDFDDILQKMFYAARDSPATTRRLPPLKHPYDIESLLLRKSINRDSTSRPCANDGYPLYRRRTHGVLQLEK